MLSLVQTRTMFKYKYMCLAICLVGKKSSIGAAIKRLDYYTTIVSCYKQIIACGFMI